MLIKDVMTPHPARVDTDATLRRAAELISVAEASDLMVTERDLRFVGVLSEGDIIRAVLPNLDEVLAAGGTMDEAFAFFIEKGSKLADQPITPWIIREPITMLPTDPIAKAAVVMVERQIRRLPVVQDGLLIATVSRADVCRAVVYYAARP